MANILEYLGMHFFGSLPSGRKRERKNDKVNTRDYWSGTTTTLETDDDYAVEGTPMEELIPGEPVEAAAEARDDAEVSLQSEEQGDVFEEEPVVAGEPEAVPDEQDDLVRVQESEPLEDASEEEVSEDALLGQIEQFRQQAKRLQKLMQDKESKAKELEDLVEQRSGRASELEQILVEREGKADELEQLVAKREEAAKGVTEEVVKRLDGIYNRMDTRLEQAEENIRGDILDGVRVDTAHLQQMGDTVSAYGRQLEIVGQGVEETESNTKDIRESVAALSGAVDAAAEETKEVHEAVSGVSGRLDAVAEDTKAARNTIEGISGSISGLESSVSRMSESASEMNAGVKVRVEGMKVSVDGMDQKVTDMADGLDGILSNVEGLPEKLAGMTESIHTESVQNYRNTAGLIKELEDRLDMLERVKRDTHRIRRAAVGALVFAILAFLAAAGTTVLNVLSMMGIL